jgi:hypothetical protein
VDIPKIDEEPASKDVALSDADAEEGDGSGSGMEENTVASDFQSSHPVSSDEGLKSHSSQEEHVVDETTTKRRASEERRRSPPSQTATTALQSPLRAYAAATSIVNSVLESHPIVHARMESPINKTSVDDIDSDDVSTRHFSVQGSPKREESATLDAILEGVHGVVLTVIDTLWGFALLSNSILTRLVISPLLVLWTVSVAVAVAFCSLWIAVFSLMLQIYIWLFLFPFRVTKNVFSMLLTLLLTKNLDPSFLETADSIARE